MPCIAIYIPLDWTGSSREYRKVEDCSIWFICNLYNPCHPFVTPQSSSRWWCQSAISADSTIITSAILTLAPCTESSNYYLPPETCWHSTDIWIPTPLLLPSSLVQAPVTSCHCNLSENAVALIAMFILPILPCAYFLFIYLPSFIGNYIFLSNTRQRFASLILQHTCH